MPTSRKGKTRQASIMSEPTTEPESSPSPRTSQNDSGDSAPIRKKARRTALTRNACIKCRLAKAKCSGKHPSCARCEASNATCVYDVSDEGVTRMQNLQQKLDVKTRDYDRVMAVFERLQSGTENEAAGLLARLRFGESVEQVTQGMILPGLDVFTGRNTELGSPQYSSSTTRFQDWPPTPEQQAYTASEPYVSRNAGSSPGLPLLAPKPVQASHDTTAIRHEQLISSISTSPVDVHNSVRDPDYHHVTPPYDPSAAYRYLPQISFNGATWPSGAEASMVLKPANGRPHPESHQPRPTQMSASRSPRPCMQPPLRPSSRSYDGFLWPCSTGDGMPGIGGPEGISTERQRTYPYPIDSYDSARGNWRRAL